MAKRRKTQPASTNPDFRGFLNVSLNDDDKKAIKATVYTADDFQSDLDRYCDSGFKFAFSRDHYNDAFQVIVSMADKDHPDYGIFCSGRGSTCLKAFKQWLYIQTKLVGESSWSENLKPVNVYVIDD